MQIVSAGIGAMAMYMFDPERGRRRRALVRDKAVSALNDMGDLAGKAGRDLRNRSQGLWAELKASLASGQVSDQVLAERVRARIGGVTSHPRSIWVSARNGHVVLTGPILAHEVEPLLKQVRAVRGVTSVENNLEVYNEPGRVPGLQGERGQRLGGGQFELLQSNWSPGIRVLAGMAGGSMALYGITRRSIGGSVMGAAGLALFARAAANEELARLFGLGARRGTIELKKTLTIDAPVDQVFALWANYQNFPYFMSNVREVTKIDDQRSHWRVAGPAGIVTEWDAVLTSYVPNHLLAWETDPASAVQHAGEVRFRPNPDETTSVDITLSYRPVAGRVGHMAAALFGVDPKQEMDADLLRMKTFIETGNRPHDAARATL
jgi:uncharacterized membrane protein